VGIRACRILLEEALSRGVPKLAAHQTCCPGKWGHIPTLILLKKPGGLKVGTTIVLVVVLVLVIGSR
jgi:hypothetical protein